ncbi:hypothetical protein FXO38_29526 [Capsicum annuum]|nr:hypothetical protein FXO38_29526 [Capsicum annuum]
MSIEPVSSLDVLIRCDMKAPVLKGNVWKIGNGHARYLFQKIRIIHDMSPPPSHLLSHQIKHEQNLAKGGKVPIKWMEVSRRSLKSRWGRYSSTNKEFKDMRFPEPILKKLKAKGIIQPTSIQLQDLPVILSGLDMIGIAFTGFEKTLVFVVPLIMVALQEEIMMPIAPGEEPFGLIVCPPGELARRHMKL